MAPLLRRTWAPRGQTPVFYQKGRSHDKISMIAALCLSPRGRHVRLFFKLHPNANITARRFRTFLKQLCRHLRGRVYFIWDRLLAHRAKLVTQFIEERPRLTVILLPPYAPELNPVEPLWSYLKSNPLAQFAPEGTRDLARRASHHTRVIGRQHRLLRSFIKATPFRQCLVRP